jgi:cell surface protein SprA
LAALGVFILWLGWFGFNPGSQLAASGEVNRTAICHVLLTTNLAAAASSGNSAFKMSFMADYTLSRLLTLSAYYERQTNTPLLSSSSYPTTTHDFGLSMKFSLTR